MKKTILFDIDGTLLLAHSAGSSVIRTILHEQFSTEYLPADQLKLGGRTDRGILTELFERHSIPCTEESFDKFIQFYLPSLKDSLQNKPPQILPGVVDLLNQLQSDDQYAIGLTTGNMKEGARLKLESCGLFEFFDFGGFGDNHSDRNFVALDAASDAKNFLNDRFDPENVLMIGDTVHDITCGHHIGATSIGVLTGSGNKEELQAAGADFIIDDLTEAKSVLEECFQIQ